MAGLGIWGTFHKLILGYKPDKSEMKMKVGICPESSFLGHSSWFPCLFQLAQLKLFSSGLISPRGLFPGSSPQAARCLLFSLFKFVPCPMEDTWGLDRK